MKHYRYRISIEPDEGNTYHAYAPALPRCHTWGDTLEEARANIRDAIDVYLRSLQADNEAIPEDNGLEILETFVTPDISVLKSLVTSYLYTR